MLRAKMVDGKLMFYLSVSVSHITFKRTLLMFIRHFRVWDKKNDSLNEH